MPFNHKALLGEQLVALITQRKSNSRISKADRKKIDVVAAGINECGYDSYSVMRSFIDHTIPETRRSRSPRNLKAEWDRFADDVLPDVVKLFPITIDDTKLFLMFKADWDAIPKDPHRLGFMFINKQVTLPMRVSNIHRGSPDFYRFLELVRHYQPEFMQRHFPLFTLRSFLAAQAEKLGSFVDRLKLGNIVSEKARERYADWYDTFFYSAELVHKAKTRPSANNPVCTSAIRLEYEIQRIDEGSQLGMATRSNEARIPFYNMPLIYTEHRPRWKPETESAIVVPPSARD